MDGTLPRETTAAARQRPFCVYTVLTGGYEQLNEQPVARESRLPFVCLTDDARLRSRTWEVRPVRPLFGGDPVRSQRLLKLCPYEQLPEFEGSLYIDNCVVLSAPPEGLLGELHSRPGLSLPRHSERASLMEEFREVLARRLDDPERVLEQLHHYASEEPETLRERPYWTGLMLRDHLDPLVRRALELWADHVLRYSCRDQLSANVAFRRAGLRPQVLAIDNRLSRFHSWPHVATRKPRPLSSPTTEASVPPDGGARELEERLRESERLLAEERRRNALFATSTTWRATRPFRALGDRVPGIARAVRVIARPFLGTAAAGRDYARDQAAPVVHRSSGRRLHVAKGDERGRQLLLSGGDLNPGTMSIWKRLLAESAWTHIFDVGANYGEMLLGVELPPAARVVAFEPNPWVLVHLVRNLAEAGVPVKVVAAAVADRRGCAELLIDRSWSGRTRLADSAAPTHDDEPDVLRVATTTLADELGPAAEASPVRALVKIDVEGDEVRVLRGLVGVLDDLEEIVVLTEILHLGAADGSWLLDHFDVELLDLGSDCLRRVDPATPDRLAALLAEPGIYPQDAVLRRRARLQAGRKGTPGPS